MRVSRSTCGKQSPKEKPRRRKGEGDAEVEGRAWIGGYARGVPQPQSTGATNTARLTVHVGETGNRSRDSECL